MQARCLEENPKCTLSSLYCAGCTRGFYSLCAINSSFVCESVSCGTDDPSKEQEVIVVYRT